MSNPVYTPRINFVSSFSFSHGEPCRFLAVLGPEEDTGGWEFVVTIPFFPCCTWLRYLTCGVDRGICDDVMNFLICFLFYRSWKMKTSGAHGGVVSWRRGNSICPMLRLFGFIVTGWRSMSVVRRSVSVGWWGCCLYPIGYTRKCECAEKCIAGVK